MLGVTVEGEHALLRRSYPAAKTLSARTAISAPLPEGYTKPWQTPWHTPQRPSTKGKPALPNAASTAPRTPLWPHTPGLLQAT